jgi:hypothetical protein
VINHETEMCEMKIIKISGRRYGLKKVSLFLDRSELGQATDGDEKTYGD